MTDDNNITQENTNENLPQDDVFTMEKIPVVSSSIYRNTIGPQSYNLTSPTIFDVHYIMREKREKADVKNASNIVGAAFIFMTAIVFILNFALVLFATIAGKSGVSVTEIIWEPAVLQVQQILFSLFSFTIPFIVVFKLANVRISSLISFSKPEKQTVIPFFLIGISFCAFANIASSFAESIFSSTNINYEVSWPENPSGISGFILSLLSTVAVPAMVEEFACRGIVLGYLRKFGEGFAVIVSAAMFGLMHGNFEQMPFAFLVGLVLGFVTVKSGTILIAMAIHAFNNAISLIFSYIPASVPQVVENVIYTVFLIICLLLGIVAIFMLHKKNVNIYKFKASDMMTQTKRKFIWFFTSVPVIIYIAVCLLESLRYFVI